MLTEQETIEMHFMVSDMEDRGHAVDVFRLRRLAETTGDDWEKLVRQCLEERLSERRNEQS